MLLILYGTAGKLGKKCREYLQNKGYELIEKYSYAEEQPIIESRHGKRVYLSKKEFFHKTDSLFRYSVANILIGFNWSQISDAVYEDKNKLLTCATTDVSMLRKIKEVYKDKVHIIYCFIETMALEGLYINDGVSSKEYGIRMSIGLSVKDCYSKNADLFDSVIIYGGEGSVFNYDTIYQQIDTIVDKPKQKDFDNSKYDIYICAAHIDTVRSFNNKYADFIYDLIEALKSHGIRVFSSWKDLQTGDNFYNSVKEAICRSRVFLPIISCNSLRSDCIDEEIMFALQEANNSALIIKPISLDGITLPMWLSEYSAYNVSSENYQGSLAFIEDWFIDMFSGESTLMKLSEEVDTCVKTSLYKRACELQKSYLTVLNNHLSMWHRNGTVEKTNGLIKYLMLSVKSKDLDRSSKIIEYMLSEITDDLDIGFYKKIANSIVDYCNTFGKSADDMYEKFYKHLNVSSSQQQNFFKVFNAIYDLSKRKHIDDNETVDVTLADKIAAYSNACVELFETLFDNGFALGYQETLISAYNRIIDYCKIVNLGNSITEKCIDRVSELKSTHDSFVTETEIGKKTLQSLKVYLGQALPDTGEYDVFISHKSADDLLADKVYNHLKNCGFEVFCDHHTLGMLHDSKYDKRIMEALEKSKHLILVASSPDYIKDGWVHDEWHSFHSDKRDNFRNGNLIMILSDELLPKKIELPSELRDGYEIIKTSEFREKINNYLW